MDGNVRPTLSQLGFNVLVLAGSFNSGFERFVTRQTILVFERRSKSFRTAVLNGRMAKNHDCRSERQPLERHMERRLNGGSG